MLNNHALVVSENGVGQHPYDQAAVCVPYDDLVAVCRAYARCDAELRISRAKLGPMVMRRFLDTPSLLSAALAGTEPAPALGDSPTRHRPTLCLVVMGKDTAAFDAMDFYDRSRPEVDELVLIKTADAQFGGQSEIANRIASRTRCDVVGVVHADTTFAKGALSALAASAYHGQQVTGLVGITLAREYVWAKTMQADSERRVSTLDGCSVFFPVAFMKEKGVSFDEQFASFHCGTEDFCLAAGACGIPRHRPSGDGRPLQRSARHVPAAAVAGCVLEDARSPREEVADHEVRDHVMLDRLAPSPHWPITASLNELANLYGADKGDGVWDRHDYAATYEALLRSRPTYRYGTLALLNRSMGPKKPRRVRAHVAALPRTESDPLRDRRCGGLPRAPGGVRRARHARQSIGRGTVGRHPRDVPTVRSGRRRRIHIAHHQKVALEALWPCVAAGGYYAIEDLHAPQSVGRAELDALVERIGGKAAPSPSPKLWIAHKGQPERV